jgi:fructose-bisphosphate aldolase class 1
VGVGQANTTSTLVNFTVLELNRYAQIAQENGLVPIVEPEVMQRTKLPLIQTLYQLHTKKHSADYCILELLP